MTESDKIDISVSGGSGTALTDNMQKSIIGINVRPATSTTAWRLQIESSIFGSASRFKVWQSRTRLGDYSYHSKIPARGIYTLNIVSASADETISVELITE